MYSSKFVSRSALMLRTVEMRIKMGTMMMQIWIKSSKSRVSPLNPSTRESVTPLKIKVTISPIKTSM